MGAGAEGRCRREEDCSPTASRGAWREGTKGCGAAKRWSCDDALSFDVT